MSEKRVLVKLYRADIEILIEDVSDTIDVLREYVRSHLSESVYIEEAQEVLRSISEREKLVAQLRVHLVR